MIRTHFDDFAARGCGRCDRFDTPECSVHRWPASLVWLRERLLDRGLVEAIKWGFPCYAWQGTNVAMLAVHPAWFGISFFQGWAIPDPDGLLVLPGPNSHQGRVLRLTSHEELLAAAPAIEALLDRTVRLHRDGLPARPPRPPDALPDELVDRLDADAALADAFAALTPGRQRSHIIYISGAKQSATRERRVEQAIPLILAGKGQHDR